jgi:hypothetical protein
MKSPLPAAHVTVDSGLPVPGQLPRLPCRSPADTTEIQENAKNTNIAITIFFITAPSPVYITVKKSNCYFV